MAGLTITCIHAWVCSEVGLSPATRDSYNRAVRVYLLCTCTVLYLNSKLRQTPPELPDCQPLTAFECPSVKVRASIPDPS